MKVGDYVTQNDNFKKNWNCDTFSMKITHITDDVIQLEDFIYVTPKDNKQIAKVLSLNKYYLKLDIKKTRQQKIEKLYAQK